MGKDRGLNGVPGVHLYVASFYAGERLLEAVHVHSLGQAVSHRLEDQGMVRYLDVARHGVVLACHLGRKDGGQQVIGAHS